MGAGISVDLRGFEEIERRLEAISMFDQIELIEFMAEDVLSLSEEAFQKETDPVTGDTWIPSLRAEIEGGQTLTDKARLRRSLTYEIQPNGTALIGSNAIYAGTHQDGFEAIPQRRFVGTPPGWEEEILEDGAVKRILRIE
jgi:phage gpG-like protein